MRFSFLSTVVLALAVDSAVATTWFGKAAYNKWHETELERWLSDHSIPYPTPSDRKDLENLVKGNWNNKVVTPYGEWEKPQLQAWLESKGQDVSDSAAASKDSLISQVKSTWTDTADTASSSFASIQTWIFDTWSDSQLKAYCDKNGIPVPQPRKRDTVLKAIRENWETASKKVDQSQKKLQQSFSYPGDWLYASWSESDLKQWLDERGYNVPQPTTRDKLIASVRRNSRLASQNMQAAAASASSSAAAAQKSLADTIFDTWSDSQIKEWADKKGIKVPQGSKRNEIIALARKHSASLLGDDPTASVVSAFGAATTKAGNQFAKATDDVQLKADDAFYSAIGTWSDSRLKAYLDARGVPVPQAGKRDELLAAVRLQKHKAASGWSAWTYDTWTTENLRKWLSSQNNKVAKKSSATRDDLLKAAQANYASASKAGGSNYASVTSYLASATDAAKDTTFDTWSQSELKAYLDSYGVKTYQGSTINELRAAARRNANYFRYGTSTPQGTLYAKISGGAQWVLEQLGIGAKRAQDEALYQGEKGADYVKEKATEATHRAGEHAQKAGDKIKEEL